MEYEDRITILAPEGIELAYVLAGLGSRFLALVLDVLVRGVTLGAVLALLAVLGATSTLLGIVGLVGYFLALFAYDIAFEVWGGGRTPGKRWTGIRVLMAGGQPVSFGASATRNLLRLVDLYMTAGIVGMISILATPRDQRIGDLAGGTIVIHEGRGLSAPVAPLDRLAAPSGTREEPLIDATAVTADELALIRDFLVRREALSADARARVASALAQRIGGKVGGLAPATLAPEPLLEAVAAAKAQSLYGGGERQPPPEESG